MCIVEFSKIRAQREKDRTEGKVQVEWLLAKRRKVNAAANGRPGPRRRSGKILRSASSSSSFCSSPSSFSSSPPFRSRMHQMRGNAMK